MVSIVFLSSLFISVLAVWEIETVGELNMKAYLGDWYHTYIQYRYEVASSVSILDV